MNLRQLEIFRAVVLGGSASRGADLLRISQPAVSRALADLEASLGFLLFERVRGQLRPTPEGRLFFAEVERSFTGLDQLRISAARIRDFGSGALRVASLAALAPDVLPKVVASFGGRHPDTAITLQVASSARVRELVVSGGFDLGVAADEVDLSSLEHRPFPDLAAVCVISAGHALARHRVVRPGHLDGLAFVALAPEDRARQRLEAVLAEHGARPRVVVKTPHSATVCALALEGVGVGLANPAATAGFLERGLVVKPFEPEVAFRASLLFHPDRRRSRAAKTFVELLLAEGARVQRARAGGARPRS